MKVLFISHYSKLYGANYSLLNMIIFLKKNYNITPVVLVTQKGQFTDRLDELNIRYSYKMWYWWVHNKTTPPVKWQDRANKNSEIFITIFNMLKKEYGSFDLIHSNSSVTNIGGYLSERFKIPHVWHIREFTEEHYNEFFNLGRKKAGEYFDKYSDQIIAVSRSLKQKYSGIIPANKIKVIYNGVVLDEHKFLRDFNNLFFEKVINFIYVGVLCNNKDQLGVLEAANILKNKYKIEKFKINFAGTGSENYLNKLKKYVKDNNLQGNVRFLGYVSDISNSNKKMDIGLISSKKEAFGRVTVEYMMSQMPVIGADSGGTSELIDHNVNGFLYPFGNYEKLAYYMKKLILEKRLIKNMALEGYKKAKDKYTAESNAQKIYSVYLTLLN